MKYASCFPRPRRIGGAFGQVSREGNDENCILETLAKAGGMHGRIVKIKQSVRQIYNARVFFGATYQGNRAQCILLDGKPDIHLLRTHTLNPSNTVCFSWRQDRVVHVRCYQGGRHIDFCGHGLLASAHAWQQRLALARDEIELLSLCTDRQDYRLRVRNGALWLRIQRPHCHAANLPADIDSYFSIRPRSAALAGGDNDYQIFQFAGGTDIATLEVNIERLRNDARATIITQSALAHLNSAQSAEAESEWSFTLRYFAPQFGIDEDVATGSANAVLADFWRQRGLSPPFHARQCSRAGGVVETDIEADGKNILLGGNVSIVQVDENSFT